jgi:hypothetical protein
MVGADRTHFVRPDHRNFQPRDRADAVVHIFENADVHVAEVARYEQADDLPPSVRQLLVTARPPLKDQMNVTRLVTLRYQVPACIHEAVILADLR